MTTSGDPVFREMSAWERAVVNRLLSVPFEGSEAVRTQIASALVRLVRDDDECHTLEIDVRAGAPIPNSYPFNRPLPVEGQFFSPGGTRVEVRLLHMKGRLSRLEFIVYGERLDGLPAPEAIEVWAVPRK